MAPQIGSNVKWSGNYIFGGDVILRKPHLASLVSAIIAEWSLAEAHLGRVFAYMIGAKHPITMTMYESVKSFEVQRDILQKVAEEVLSKRNSEIFAAALTVLGRTARTRHKFAHWIWGFSADAALDALLLVEPKHFWRLSIKQYKYHKTAGVVGIGKPLTRSQIASINAMLPVLERGCMYVYREQDLVEEAMRMENAMVIADKLRRLVSLKGAQQQAIYRQLYSDADIQSALARAKKVPPSNDPTPRAFPKKASRKKPSPG